MFTSDILFFFNKLTWAWSFLQWIIMNYLFFSNQYFAFSCIIYNIWKKWKKSGSVSPSVVSDFLWSPWTIACQAPLSMDSPGKEYWTCSHSLLQGIFPTQEMNWVSCIAGILPLSHQNIIFPFHFLLVLQNEYNEFAHFI